MSDDNGKSCESKDLRGEVRRIVQCLDNEAEAGEPGPEGRNKATVSLELALLRALVEIKSQLPDLPEHTASAFQWLLLNDIHNTLHQYELAISDISYRCAGLATRYI